MFYVFAYVDVLVRAQSTRYIANQVSSIMHVLEGHVSMLVWAPNAWQLARRVCCHRSVKRNRRGARADRGVGVEEGGCCVVCIVDDACFCGACIEDAHGPTARPRATRPPTPDMNSECIIDKHA